MARIFLSYDRDDAAKARTMAEALENAGHDVWWDFHIRGGTEYSKEIEQALDGADAVVVLWSRYSVDSPWVRDEAAAGRDRGRLVPIRLDETKPPMGFRQFQCINLGAWKGRGTPTGMQEILTSIAAHSGERQEPQAKAKSSIGAARWDFSHAVLPASVAGLIFAAAALAYFLVNRSSTSSATVVAVVAADNSQSTRSLASDLFIKLGSLQSTNSEALQLVDQGSVADSDLTFRVSQQAIDDQSQASVALLGGNGGLLWSREFPQKQRSVADLQQQVAYSAALVLACATEAMAPEHEKLEDVTLRLYLGGCARMSGESDEEPQSLADTFSKVTQQAPDFEGGWAKLLISETYAFLMSSRDPAVGASLQAHIKQARRLNPTMAEAYVAEAWMQPLRQINRWMPLSEAAVAKNPVNVWALTEHANDMYQVGRLQQGVAYARRAVQADPLSPAVRHSLMVALANAGEIEAAKDVLKEVERLWPGASTSIDARFFLMAEFDDPREALSLLRSGKVSRRYISPAMESFLEAKSDPSPAMIDRALEEARSVSKSWTIQYFDTLAEFGRKEELIKELFELELGNYAIGPAEVFRPKYRMLREDVRFMAIMNHLGHLAYWRKSGKWPDFCFEPGLPYDCKVEAAKLAGTVS